MFSPTKQKKKYDYVDDDCVILDDDPDKKNHVEVNNHNDSEDLVIVGEKGQIACRDYPHARHLCAKFLFASTPHEQHCLQCHCYVCDSLAPCIYWGTGTSNTDHCHSSDQDPFWKAQRKNFKQGNKVPLLLPQPPNIPILPLPQAVQVPVLTPDQNQLARLAAIRACATLTNSATQNLVHQRLASQVLSRNKFNTHLVSQQLHSSLNNVKQNFGRQSPNNLGAQYLNRPRIFKRRGSNGVALPTSRSGNHSIMNNNVSQNSRNPPPLPGLSNRSSAYRQIAVTGVHSQQNYDGSSIGSMAPSLARVLSQLNGGDSFAGSVPCQSQPYNNQFNSFADPVRPLRGSSQPNTNCFQNQVPFQSQVFPQLNTGGYFALTSSEVNFQPHKGVSSFKNPVPFQPQLSAQTNMCSGHVNPVYPRKETYNQPNNLQQGNETQTAKNPSSANFPPRVFPTDHNKQIENFPAQNQALTCHQLPFVPQYDSSVIPDNNNQLSFFDEPDPWMEGYVDTDGFDLCLPEAATVDTEDTGPLFDYLDLVF